MLLCHTRTAILVIPHRERDALSCCNVRAYLLRKEKSAEQWLCYMADVKNDAGMNPEISEEGDSDDEVSLLVVDEDELQTALDTAGISIKVTNRNLRRALRVPGGLGR